MLKNDKQVAPLHGEFDVVYRTTQGKPYPLQVGFAVVPIGHVRIDIPATTEACKTGCGLYGRNGGCPPFSPNFDDIPGHELLVLYAKLLTKHFPPRVLSGPYYSRWVFVETFLTPLMNRIGRGLAVCLGGYFLSSGNCQLCRPKRCAVKEGLACRKPKGRTYSLEATGVLVTELMKDVFGLELQWWRRDDPVHIPEYMIKVVGLKGDEFAQRGCNPKTVADGLSLQCRMSVHGYSNSSIPCSVPSI